MPIRGLLLDLEGVLYQEGAAIAGATDALAALRASGLAIRYLTNTTVRPRRAIAEDMAAMGLAVEVDEIFTPTAAAARLLAEAGIGRVHLAAEPDLAEDLAGFELVEAAPEAVILGDLYKGFDWDRLNALFEMVRGGARLVALHKNRVSRRDGRIALDLGPFVAALEYGADVTADVVGKPAGPFFELALASLGVAAPEALMVGDDLEADIGGAQAVGLKTVQVRTGKWSERDLDHPALRPDALVDSIAELPAVLSSLP